MVVGWGYREALQGKAPCSPSPALEIHTHPPTHTHTHRAGALVLTFSFLALPLLPLLPLTPFSLCLIKSIQASLGSKLRAPSAVGSWNTVSPQVGSPSPVAARQIHGICPDVTEPLSLSTVSLRALSLSTVVPSKSAQLSLHASLPCDTWRTTRLYHCLGVV